MTQDSLGTERLSKYYVDGGNDPLTARSTAQNNSIEKKTFSKEEGTICLKDDLYSVGTNTPEKVKELIKGQQESVNEIIVKVEMKKFQNLIENRVRHKNSLL